MMVSHHGLNASPPVPIPPDADTGEGIGERIAYIGERLTILAVAARVMARRHPEDVYARSIEREAFLLARSMRDALTVDTTPHAGRIVDAPPTPATPAASTSPMSDTAPDAGVTSSAPRSTAPRSTARQDTRRGRRASSASSERETPHVAPPEARQGAPVSNSTQRTPAPEAGHVAPSRKGARNG